MTYQQLIATIDEHLRTFEAEYPSRSLREKVLALASLLKATRKLSAVVVRESGCDANQSRERIRLYLVAHVGLVIDAIELEVVSGISDYGRRIRELRVQDGYEILTGSNDDPDSGIVLKPSQYILLRAAPDRDAAHRWYAANRIRREKDISAKDRILKYFKANLRKIVTTDELAYVAGIQDYQRRIRELRTEEGYAIATRFTGRPDLQLGEYVLEDDERVAEPHDRHIPEEVQRKVYTRDDNTCRLCGGKHGEGNVKVPSCCSCITLSITRQVGQITKEI